MKVRTSPLFSEYVIDGMQMEDTPFSALLDLLDGNGTVDVPKGPFASIVTDSLARPLGHIAPEPSMTESYIQEILQRAVSRKDVELCRAAEWTAGTLYNFLTNLIFRDGHFSLQQLLIMATWDWNNHTDGAQAAFYHSTTAMAACLEGLGIKLDRYFVEDSWRRCTLSISLRTNIPSRRKCPATMYADSSDWLIYIPFGDCRMQLGGSALEKILKGSGGTEMALEGCAPYFADCFEVVRELIEDGVVTAGITVGHGGLAVAAEKFRNHKTLELQIGGYMTASGESDPIKVLFAEMPGVLVQIKDIDFDYIDSQFLLQEVAYYPVGHPGTTPGRLSISTDDSCVNVSGILQSLLTMASEGED